MEKTKGKKFQKLEKLNAFFERNFALFFAPIIVAFLYICALGRYDVYPFGDKFTVASYDLSAQICPFIEHLFSVMKGESALTYSYAIVGGADVTGTFLYFFISPFSFLFLIFGEGRVAHASSIVMLCKLATIAVAGTWFAKKMFRNIPEYICIAVGVAYAYCGYTFVANTYINWMDFLIYLPFCAGAFRRFVKTGKFLPFSILMACCVYTCFSIACFSMFTVYPALIAYAIFCVKREERKAFITKLSLAFVVTVLISLPVLLPAFMATTTSARGEGLFDNLWSGYSDGELVKKDFLNSLSDSMYAKWSYIFTDGIFIILTLVWFGKKGLKDGFARFMLIAGILTLLPLLVDESMKLLNMGSYYAYALRFGFLNALYFLGGGCLCLESFFEKKENEEQVAEVGEKAQKGKKSNAVWLAIVIFVGAVATAVTLTVLVAADIFVRAGNSEYNEMLVKIAAVFPKSWENAVKEVCDTIRDMGGAFAHGIGNLEVIIFPFFFIMLTVAVGCAVYPKVGVKVLSYILIVAVGAQVLLFNGQLVIGNRSTQYETLDSYKVATERLAEIDDGYYRIKDFGNEYSYKDDDGKTQYKVDETLMGNAPFYGGHSYSVFSSVIDKDNFITYPLFWYNGNSTNSLKSLGRGKSFADAFLGYKYYWLPDDKEDREAADELSYLTPLYTNEKDEEGNYILFKEGNFVLYENTIVLPNAYVLPRGDFKFPNENDKEDANRKANQKALFEFLGGTAYTEEEFPGPTRTKALSKKLHEDNKARGVEIEVGAGKITAKATAQKDGECLFLNFVASKGYTVTVNGEKADLIDNDLKYLSVALQKGENTVVFTYSSPYTNYALIGLAVAVVGLLAIALVVKKTKWLDKLSPVIAYAGVILAGGVVAFFMVYPTGIFIAKLFDFLKLLI